MIYNSALLGEAVGEIDYENDTFFVLLVGAGYSFDKKTHTNRGDVSADEIVADGYTVGGQGAEFTITTDDINDRVDIELGGVVWNPSTITAHGAVYYKSNGGAPEDDELIYYNDFEGPVSSTNAAFTLNSSMIRKQNS